MSTVHATAVAAHTHGLCVIPAATDGTKRPGVRSWKEYQHDRPDPQQLERWFTNPGAHPGLGLVCGQVSGGLEMLELEGRAVDEGIYDQLLAAAADADLDELLDRIILGYEERTPSGGIHWLYRCAEIAGNTKLARRPATPDELATNPHDRIKPLIETRGEGGFTIIAPSAGPTHPTGRPWTLTFGGVDQIATISPEERAELHRLCATFDQIPPPASTTSPPRSSDSTGDRPGDTYNASTSWADILEPHGWVKVYQRGDETGWRRPGKTHGISATTNHLGTDRLKVFSSSTPFDTERTYDRFGAYALLEHDGDLSRAAKALAPERTPTRARSGPDTEAPPPSDDDVPPSDDGGAPGVTPSGQVVGFTELSNARRLIRDHGTELRHVAGIGWHHWDGRRWRYDDDGETIRRLKTVVDGLRQIVFAIKDPKAQDKCLAAWRSTQRWSHIAGALTLASSEQPVVAAVDQLDTDPWTLNVENGTLDLRTGTLRAHDPGNLNTKLAPVRWDPDARCPRWTQFLDTTFAGDTNLIRYAQRLAGYAATGKVSEHVLPVLYGTGANGKSTFTGIIRHILGDYAAHLPADILLASKHEPHPTGLTDLRGARFAVSVEVDQGRRLAESLVKMLTGGENIRARRMRQDFFEFAPTHTLALVCNHLPTVRGTDDGIWRRIHVVPFTVTVPEADRDPELPEQLAREASGILNWLVDGARAWAEHGLDPPDVVRLATNAHRSSSDHLGAFIGARCAVEPDARVRTKDLRSAYEDWCTESEEEPLNRNLWGRLLTDRGHPTDGNRHHRVGLRLVTDDDIFSALTNDIATRRAGDATDSEENGDRAQIAQSSVPSITRGREEREPDERADRARVPAPTESGLVPCASCGRRVPPAPGSLERGWATTCRTCIDNAKTF